MIRLRNLRWPNRPGPRPDTMRGAGGRGPATPNPYTPEHWHVWRAAATTPLRRPAAIARDRRMLRGTAQHDY